ncbi:hypothetical protein [Pectobacterium peruviense]|uniref:Uncharacterized protein n=1 Tax=Pectobacterium peruviense TaxID=2066479 RepID=A0ABX4SBD0_9GAMM|nr:hypothetical protein [Pectobacterium peruviense]KML70010.1 hypothetical protein G033_02755 [Pectobacterium peruviense]PKX82772.1 hypothetical protein A0G02_13645 [Pectobacterium peruviense]PKX87048.1 hypothetical protein A0G03_09110 [Pectobacterium peruviense]
MNPTYTALIALLRSGEKAFPEDDGKYDGSNSQFSVRIKPESRAFLDMHAERMGVSKSTLYGIILEGGLSEARTSTADKMMGVYERFCLLMDTFGLSALQQAQLLAPFGISQGALSSAERTLDLLNPQVLHQLALWFEIDVQWLLCEKNYPMSNNYFFDNDFLNHDVLSDDIEVAYFRAVGNYEVTLAFTKEWKDIQGIIRIPIIKVYRVLKEWEVDCRPGEKTKSTRYLTYSQRQVESLTFGSVFPVMIVDKCQVEYQNYQDWLVG